MFTTSRRISLFAISALLLAGAVVLAAWHSRHDNSWQHYQQIYFQRIGQPADIRVRQIVPQMTGQVELCTTCHMGLSEISPSHPVAVFGCVSCHGGNGLALDANQAHAGLRGGKNPSDLAVVQQSCGQGCHSGFSDEDLDQVDRVLRSLQATYAGGIATVRFAFGAQPNATPVYAVNGVTDNQITTPHGLAKLEAFPHDSTHASVTTPHDVRVDIDQQFTQNCLNGGCHLSTEPRQAPYFYRSTGCAACHVPYNSDGLYQGNDPTIPRDEPGHMVQHQMTTAIPFSQCNHCHNRGNYSLRQMDFLLRPDIPPAGPPISAQMPAEGRRLIEYYQPIGQFTQCEWTLDCVDCHTEKEIMGDGDIHPDQKEMQYTQCRTCHGTSDELPKTKLVSAEDATALRQAQLNPNYDLKVGDQVLVTDRGELMGNIKVVNGAYILTSKVTGQQFPFNPVKGSGCLQNVDQQGSQYCHECHSYAR